MTDEQLMQQALDALNCGWSSGETDVLGRAKAIMALRERLAQLASKQEPRKTPIPPPGADAFNVVYAEGWNACCDAYFGGVEPLDPVIITVTEQALQQPLSKDQVSQMVQWAGYDAASPQERADFINGIRHREAGYGIKEKP